MSKQTMGVRIHSSKYEAEAHDKWVTTYHTEVPNHQGQFVMALIERWGMVAAIHDGEDSSGRAKMRLQAPIDVVERAIECAQLTFKLLRETGLMVEVPDINEINADNDTKRKTELALNQNERAELKRLRSDSTEQSDRGRE